MSPNSGHASTASSTAATEVTSAESLLLLSAQLAYRLLSADQPQQVLQDAMAQLGEATGVDRVYLFEYRNEPQGEPAHIADQRLEWVATGVESQLDNSDLQGLDVAAVFPRVHDHAQRGASFFGDIDSFEPSERAILETQGILSLLIVPVLLGEQLWGFLGFDAVRQLRRWSASDESVLRLMAATLAAAIEQQRARALLSASQAQLEHLAHSDSLTGLANRRQAELTLDHMLQSTAETRFSAVLLLDIDQFKRVNDSLGHRYGDRLLVEVARRLGQLLQPGDALARLGGDEFQIVLPGQTSLQQIKSRAEALCEGMRTPFHLGDRVLFATVSIGISVHPLHARDADVLLQHADLALYRAKQEGRDQARLFSEDMQANVRYALYLEEQLRNAVQQQRLQLLYLPRLDLRSGRINGAEALLRVRGEDGHWLHTPELIDLAESMGLILPIGRWVIDAVCRQAGRWRQQRLPAVTLAINVSARQFHDPNLPSLFDHALEAYGLAPSQIEVELTESTLMERPAQALRMLQQLRHRGISRALDDFGTGYSSLSYLQRFPFDRIKIDQLFVANLPEDPGASAIAASMADLAHRLGLRIVAEGVEQPAQLAFLRQHDFDEAQGFLLGRPMPAAELEQLLRKIGTTPSWPH